jgi:hypothetical protein
MSAPPSAPMPECGLSPASAVDHCAAYMCPGVQIGPERVTVTASAATSVKRWLGFSSRRANRTSDHRRANAAVTRPVRPVVACERPTDGSRGMYFPPGKLRGSFQIGK